MPNLVVRKRVTFPTVGTWKWTDEDFVSRHLSFSLAGAKALLYLDPGNPLGSKRADREVIWEGRLELTFSPVPDRLKRGLQSKKGSLPQEAAQTIYDCYVEVIRQFEIVLRTAGRVKNLPVEDPTSFRAFYSEAHMIPDKVSWRIDSDTEKVLTQN